MDNFFNDIDVREEIEYILEHNSIKILYVRNNRETRCKCFDPLHEDGKSNCLMCGGTGYLSSIEVIEAFLNPASQDDMLRMSGEKFTNLGDANLYTDTFYFKHKNTPNVGDRILIVGFDKHGLPTDVKESLHVSLTRRVRGYKGRTELYKVIARSSAQSLSLDNKRLRQVPNADKFKMMKGTKYQWGN